MDIVDPHIHCISRTTDDYERMALAGVRAVIEPAFWLGEARTNVGCFKDYFRLIGNFERTRAAQFGIKHYCCIALNPREANDGPLAREVLDSLDEFLAMESCVAVGEIGYDELSPNEDIAVHEQIELAKKHKLPIMAHTPHRDKLAGVKRLIDMFNEHGCDPSWCLIDHNIEETTKTVRDWGGWAGHTVYPTTKLTPARAANIFDELGTERMMVNSSADWGISDPLSVPRVVAELRSRDWSEDDIHKLVWRNPIEFYARSGRLTGLS